MNFRFAGEYVFIVVIYLLDSGKLELLCYKLFFRICISVHRYQIHPLIYTCVNSPEDFYVSLIFFSLVIVKPTKADYIDI